MAAEQEALRRRIAEKRQEIAEDLDRLSGELRHDYRVVSSPRNLVRRWPLPALGLAVGVGLLAGLTVAGLLLSLRRRASRTSARA